MSKKVYVYSTLNAGQVFNTEAGRVEIFGGANISNQHLYTPRGVATRITEDQLEALKRNDLFQSFSKDGYLSVSFSEKDPNKAAKDMNPADNSAQLTPERLKGKGKSAPVKKD